ncbi:hypothetical protein [Mechercharimyces sp. CAU 1602]|uniref:hypothetical protein n=1 Tax=Mechercharimyces sp. CAU 1602 TaxID=2973933 RepID=UPI00216167D2|nr:hypothetical protein [Mechercharimyces sp. CAU 1602]MCS1350024.1 hypothetical protein [Mechercharimyces sp. CAU 1602]
MNYVKPQVQFENEVSATDAVEWTVVAIIAIIAMGGAAAYCTYKGGSFAGGFDWSKFTMNIGCDLTK